MKEFKELIKELYKDKRKKGLVSLLLWFLFFVIIFLFLGNPRDMKYTYIETSNSNDNTVKVSKSSLENFKTMENFEYSYLITINENNITNTYKVDGTYYNEKYYFETSGYSYYLKDNNIYLVDDSLKQLTLVGNLSNNNSVFNYLDLKLLTKDNINTFITSSEKVNEVTYKDGNGTKEFRYTNYDNRIINITTKEYGNIINSIELDFSKYFGSKYQVFSVVITYKNVNNISEYNKNYDDYEIKDVGK